ncbi:aldose 1-epimerase family protein [Embleya sp. AB8]|uniref:aldose 1-epimerase family protein n=1 Tax=Embleya sp. AB8 TaxID=3156304 RepID=UPI003C770C6B
MSDFVTGEQFEITAGPYWSTITEVGAGLRELTREQQPLVLSYTADEPAPAAFGQVLIPWPNRVDRGRYTFEGETYQLDVSEPELGNAIHGLVRWATWRPVERAADRVRMACAVHGSTGYPFRLDVEVEYRLDAEAGLTVTVAATNRGSRPLPYAHGAHPYLTVGEPIDGCTVRVPGSRYQPVDRRMIPSGPQLAVDGGEYDLRAGRRLGDQAIDVAYTGLEYGPDGRAWVHLTGTDRRTSLWLDEAQPWLEIYTADHVPLDRRRRGLGVEPMTAPPNAFGSGTDLIRLAPGTGYTGSWGITAG